MCACAVTLAWAARRGIRIDVIQPDQPQQNADLPPGIGPTKVSIRPGEIVLGTSRLIRWAAVCRIAEN